MELVNNLGFDAIRKGDYKAYEALFRTYYAPLVRFATDILKDQDAAEDRVQEVFVKIWERRSQIRIEQSLKAYLYMAVKNHCFNMLKTEQRQVFMEDGDVETLELEGLQTSDLLDTKLLSGHIHEAIEKLPPKCALIFKMSRYEDKTYKEIAETLSLSVKTVENQMGKALMLMRRYLAPYLYLVIIGVCCLWR